MSPEQLLEKQNDTGLDEKSQAELDAYEAKLRAELGLADDEAEQWTRPEEKRFTRNSRETTTILFGGLTLAHEELLTDTMTGLGYKVAPLPCPDNVALALGKEFGNRGQCNPTYYTVGNLVKYLQYLRDEKGMSVPDIKDQFVFLTAGACGPCRFGMYEAEYRKALNDAGFAGFRVLLFEQTKGISQAAGDEAAEKDGLEFTKDFFMGLITAVMVGDLLNDMGYQLRPYEKNKGQTAAVLVEAKKLCGEALRKGEKMEPALRRVREMFAKIPCDFTRVKPKVKITGEFWAMTTEGDGNYHMGSWLESEGAQVQVEPVTTWIDYLMYIGKYDIKRKFGLPLADGKVNRLKQVKSWVLLSALKYYFRNKYDGLRKVLGMKPLPLPDQGKIHKFAREYYTADIRGGEGHMEVGKNIYAVVEKKAHMVISVKPFGCMPSTQSDGVQSKVVNDYPDCIFIPIETSGDGEINVKSRVQMKLYEAKVRCREEFNRVLEGYGFTVEQFRAYVDANPQFAHSLLEIPHQEVGVASNLLHLVAKKMKRHYSRKVDQKLSVQEVERLAREAAAAENAACVSRTTLDNEQKADVRAAQRVADDKAEHDARLLEDSQTAHAHADEGCCGAHNEERETEGSCCRTGTCEDTLPGEQRQRPLEATVNAAAAELQGSAKDDCCGGSCGC